MSSIILNSRSQKARFQVKKSRIQKKKNPEIDKHMNMKYKDRIPKFQVIFTNIPAHLIKFQEIENSRIPSPIFQNSKFQSDFRLIPGSRIRPVSLPKWAFPHRLG